MKRARYEIGWSLVGYCSLVLAAMTVVLLTWYGTGTDGTRALIRATARTSLVLFLAAFVASAVYRRWPVPVTRWLAANRRYLGVSFAVSHTLHLLAIVALARIDPSFQRDIGALVGGGIAYVLMYAMVATSFDRSAAWLGPRAWNRLHKIGMYYIWMIFFVSYAPRALASAPYLPAAILLVVALGLRLTTGKAPQAALLAAASRSG